MRYPVLRLGLGGLAALLVAAPAARAQGGMIPAKPRDTMYVRLFDAAMRARIDSIMQLNRELQDEPFMSPQFLKLRAQVESMVDLLAGEHVGDIAGRRMLVRKQDFFGAAPRSLKGWIGLNLGPVLRGRTVRGDSIFDRFYARPVIVSVDPESPAQRAGIVSGDLLVAYDGQDVVSHDLNMSRLLEPERKLAVTVRRDGENRDYTVVVAKAPERVEVRRLIDPRTGEEVAAPPPPPGVISFRGAGPFYLALPGSGGPTGVFGASLMNLTPELAKALRRDPGVLVTEAGESSLAYRAGLRTGDLIAAVDGQPVSTTGETLMLVQRRANERSVALQVLHEGKPRKIIVSW